jgi:small GTP-binding protein
MVSKKVILTGSFGVGKTSLFNRFLYSRFSEKYLTTIGVKVDKKVIDVNGRELSLLIWDIAGEVFQNKVPHTYFLGASGVIYVFDLTRPMTYEHIEEDITYLKKKLPQVVIKIVGNKMDLIDDWKKDQVTAAMPLSYDILTSAKTGENVEELFQSLGKSFLDHEPPPTHK